MSYEEQFRLHLLYHDLNSFEDDLVTQGDVLAFIVAVTEREASSCILRN